MWKMLLNFVGGGLIGQIGKEINQWHEVSLKAENEKERVEADKEVARLQARKEVLVAEARDRINRLARVGLAFPFGIYTYKIIIWDKVLALGTTDDLPSEMWYLMGIIFSFYFVADFTKNWRK